MAKVAGAGRIRLVHGELTDSHSEAQAARRLVLRLIEERAPDFIEHLINPTTVGLYRAAVYSLRDVEGAFPSWTARTTPFESGGMFFDHYHDEPVRALMAELDAHLKPVKLRQLWFQSEILRTLDWWAGIPGGWLEQPTIGRFAPYGDFARYVQLTETGRHQITVSIPWSTRIDSWEKVEADIVALARKQRDRIVDQEKRGEATELTDPVLEAILAALPNHFNEPVVAVKAGVKTKEHFEWWVDYQIRGRSPEQIAKAVHNLAHDEVIGVLHPMAEAVAQTAERITKEIKRVSNVLRVERRLTPGRPAGSRTRQSSGHRVTTCRRVQR